MTKLFETGNQLYKKAFNTFNKKLFFQKFILLDEVDEKMKDKFHILLSF
jgi:hypothetical protein